MKKLINNKYVFSFLTKGVIAILGVISSIFINRYLGPTLKGEYAYYINIVNIIVLILNLGVYQSYPFFRRKGIEDIKNKYFSVVASQFIAYLMFGVIIAVFMGNLFSLVIVFLACTMILNRQLSFIVLVENINLRNKINVGNQIFYTFSLVVAYYLIPPGLTLVCLLLLIKEILSIFKIVKKFKFRFSLSYIDYSFIYETIKFGFIPMLTALLITLNYKVDILILNKFVDYREIGLYSVGIGLANQVWLIPDAFKDVLFSRTAKSDSISDIVLSIKVNLYIGFIIVGFIFSFGESLLRILYGVEYVPAYDVTVIIFIGLLPMIFYKMIISLYNAKGKQVLTLKILSIAVLLNVIINFLIIPTFGIVGAAWASVVSYSLCGILFTRQFCKDYDIPIQDLILINKQELLRIKNVIR